MMSERLWEIYEQMCQVEMKPLPEFVHRLKMGEFGDDERADVVAFLREIEAGMVSNIQTKAMEHSATRKWPTRSARKPTLMFEDDRRLRAPLLRRCGPPPRRRYAYTRTCRFGRSLPVRAYLAPSVIADHFPVKTGKRSAAALRVRGAERHVHRAADLHRRTEYCA